MNTHLHILHLFPNTENDKVNNVAQQRQDNLLIELKNQNITDYSLIPGFYDPINTKQAIHKGHHAIVQMAKDKGYENVLIAEDDCCFTSPNSFQYFLSQIPKSYDLFFSLIYAGDIVNNRVMNGFSGGCTLYSIHSRFYDVFLEQALNSHVDRELGNLCFKYEYFVVPQYCVVQRGGWSFNLKQSMFYDAYLVDKKLYGVD